MRRAICAASVFVALGAAGCGGEDEPPAAVDEHDPGAAPAATGTDPEPGDGEQESGELSSDDEAAVEQAVRRYIAALNAHDGGAACALFEPGALDLAELPNRAGGCAASLEASIGRAPGGGAPAWKRTNVAVLNEVSVGEDRARVTATVNHDFADRGYRSVEEDVIYLDRAGDGWLLAKPSGTFYRAVGYPEPPLRALTPP